MTDKEFVKYFEEVDRFERPKDLGSIRKFIDNYVGKNIDTMSSEDIDLYFKYLKTENILTEHIYKQLQKG